jgi:hypothetical protein
MPPTYKPAKVELLATPLLTEAGTPGIEYDPDVYHLSTWRLLSATLVEQRWLDFTHENARALREGFHLFEGSTVFVNHSRDVREWVGRIARVWWDDGSSEAGGRLPGINAAYLLHREKANKEGMLIQGIEMGAVNKTSASFEMAWVPSHPKLRFERFLESLGKKVDGQVVRVLPTRILEANEASIVWKGADPTAGMLPNGSPGARVFLSADLAIEWPEGTPPAEEHSHEEEGTSMDLNKLAAALGWQEGDLTPDKVEIALAQYTDRIKTARITELEGSVEKLNADLQKANGTIEEQAGRINALAPKEKIADAALAKEREEALRLFDLVNGKGEEHEPLRKQIREADYAVALAHQKTYANLAKQKLGGDRAKGSEGSDNQERKGSESFVSKSRKRFASTLYPAKQ